MTDGTTISNYTQLFTQRVESILLDLWGHLGEYHRYLVLVGGLAPRYITAPAGTTDFSTSQHCGTLDIDLGISLAVREEETYRHIHRILKEFGFSYARNEDGSRKSHSFEFATGYGIISLDFLTTAYSGMEEKRVQKIEHEMSAIKVYGIGLALKKPLLVRIDGRNLQGDLVSEQIQVCRPVAYVLLKALAFDSRHKDKDSYDLVYTLMNYMDGAASVAQEVLEDDRKEESFNQAIEVLKTRYASPDHDDPRAYSRFCMRQSDAPIAFAAVQEFLSLTI